MLFSKEISGLKATIADLTGQITTLTEEKTTLISDHTAAIEKLTADHTEAIRLKDERISTLENEAKAAKETEGKRIETAVITQIADAGVDPIARDEKAAVGDTKEQPGAGLKGLEKARAILSTKQPTKA